jgi:hypothetical protein
MHCRHADRRRIERLARGEASFDRRKTRNAELCRGLSRNGRVAVDYGDKLDCNARLFELAVDAKMVAPEGSRSNDGDA